MDERLKESISALVDDEANELEIQRVLSNLNEDVVETWQSYHAIKDSISGQAPTTPSIDIRQSLAEQLDYEIDARPSYDDDTTYHSDAYQDELGQSSEAKRSNTVSLDQVRSEQGRSGIIKGFVKGPIFGVAASALFALILVTQYQGVQDAAQPDLLASDSQLLESETLYAQTPVVNAEEEAFNSQTVAVRQPKIIDEFSEEHARQFNQYLLRHAEHSVYGFSQGVMPLARVASVNSVGL